LFDPRSDSCGRGFTNDTLRKSVCCCQLPAPAGWRRAQGESQRAKTSWDETRGAESINQPPETKRALWPVASGPKGPTTGLHAEVGQSHGVLSPAGGKCSRETGGSQWVPVLNASPLPSQPKAQYRPVGPRREEHVTRRKPLRDEAMAVRRQRVVACRGDERWTRHG